MRPGRSGAVPRRTVASFSSLAACGVVGTTDDGVFDASTGQPRLSPVSSGPVRCTGPNTRGLGRRPEGHGRTRRRHGHGATAWAAGERGPGPAGAGTPART